MRIISSTPTTNLFSETSKRKSAFLKIALIFFFAICFCFKADAQVSVTATVGTLGPTSYTNVSNAFNAINQGTHKGVITISITGNTSGEGSYSLDSSGANSGVTSYTSVSISPSGGAWTVSTSDANGSCLELYGAQNVTIDGLNSGGNSLTIQNTFQGSASYPGTNTIEIFIGGNNVTIKNCTIKGNPYGGSSTSPSAFTGVVWLNSTTGTRKATNITIDHCNIGPYSESGECDYGVSEYGYTTQMDTSCTVSNCNIYDFSKMGVYLTTGTGNNWNISNNSFYRTSANTYTTSVPTGAIYINLSTSYGHTISGNYIGGQSTGGGAASTPWSQTTGSAFVGIYLSVGTTRTTTVTGNIIQNYTTSLISVPSFTGIQVATGNVNIGDGTDADQNVIGNASSTYGITSTGTSNGGIYGIYISAPSGNTININDNTLANLAYTYAGNVQGPVWGIYYSTTAIPSINKCKIYDLSTASAYTSSIATPMLAGIYTAATSAVSGTITNNIIDSLYATSTAATLFSIYGIFTEGTSTNPPAGYIYNNFIHSLKSFSSSATPVTAGIYLPTSYGGFNVYNNFMRLGEDASGATITQSAPLYGIYYGGGAQYNNNFFYNSIYIGGTGITGAANSYCFYLGAAQLNAGASKTLIENNIFFNNRQNSSGSFYNYAIANNGITTNVTCNYNDIYAANAAQTASSVSGSATPISFATWKTNTGFDANSQNNNPNFNAPDAATASLSLNLGNLPSVCANAGLNITTPISITTDYYGTTRCPNGGCPGGAAAPDIGAYEGNFLPPLIITYTALANTASTSAPTLSSVTVTPPGSYTVSGQPLMYYKLSTDANAFNDNTNGTAGWKYVTSSSGSGTGPYSFTPNFALLYNSPTIGPGTTIQYFVVGADNNNDVGINAGTFSGTYPTSIPLSSGSFPIGGTLNSYSITIASGTVTVGTGGNYPSLTNAGGLFQALNSSTLTGHVTVQIVSNLTPYTEGGTGETGTYSLNAVGGSSAADTILIQPSSATLDTIAGTGVTSAAPMINFNGGSNVIIDGSYSGSGQYLLFRNTNSAAGSTGPTIQFTNGSAGDTLRNCFIENNATTVTAGAVTIGATGTNNVYISGNNIHDATSGSGSTTGTVATAIYSNNATNTVSIVGNNIYNWSTNGVNLPSVAAGCSVANNNFYFSFNSGTATIAQTAINVAGAATAGNYSITGNYIGGQSATPGGSAWTNSATTGTFTGISLTGATTSTNQPSEIYNNTIQNLTFSGSGSLAFTGITESGFVNIGYNKSGVSQTGNTIGGTYAITYTGYSSGAITGITVTANTSTVTAGTFICNNTISNITTFASVNTSSAFTGISATSTGGATVTTSIQNNVINSITLNGTSSETFTGINVPSGTSNTIALGNVSPNIIGSTSVGNNIQNKGSGATTGITVTTTANSNHISGNTVAGFTNNNATPAFTGIAASVGSTSSSEISNNTIQLLTLSGVGAFEGIYVSAGLVKVGVKNADSTAFANTIGSTGSVTNIQFASTTTSYGIYITSSANANTVSNNTVAGITGTASGSSAIFYGIFVTAGTAAVTEIANNQVGLISIAGTTSAGFQGIYAATGWFYVGVKKDGVTAAGNTVGDPSGGVNYIKFTGASSGVIIGIQVSSTASAANLVSNNNVGDVITTSSSSTSGITGIYVGAVSTTNATLIQANTIKNFTLAGTGIVNWTGISGVSSTTGLVTIGSSSNSALGNIIGGTSGTGTVTSPGTGYMIGISLTGTSAVTHTIGNNTINGFTSSATSTTPGIAGIYLSASSSLGNTVSNNIIQNFIVNSAGTAPVYGIYYANAPTVAGSIQGNTIQGITMNNTGSSSKFTGIYIPSGWANVTSNIIGAPAFPITYAGSASSVSPVPVSGIYETSSAGTTGNVVTASGNIIQNINLTYSSLTGPYLTALYWTDASTTVGMTVSGNTIRDLSSAAPSTGTAATSAILGMFVSGIGNGSSTNVLTVTGNTIDSLVDNAAAAVNIVGMEIGGGATVGGHVVGQNLIHSFISSSATSVQQGIYCAQGIVNYQNNMIRLGIDNNNNSNSGAANIVGIYNNNGTNCNFYFNTVYIGGTATSGAINTACYQKTQSNTYIIENNIFFNARTNSGSTGKHYAYLLNNVTTTTSDYNIYYTPNSGGVLANTGSDQTTLSALKTATGGDSHSAVGDPVLYGSTGSNDGAGAWTTSTNQNNLSLAAGTPAYQTGITVSGITNDFFGDLRPYSGHTNPNIGADEYTSGTINDIFAPVITYTTLGNQLSASSVALPATITDQGTGVPLSGSLVPQIWYRKSSGTPTAWAHTSGTNNAGNGNSGTWSFTIDYSQIGGYTPAAGDVIQYYVVAQDQAGTPNIGYNPFAGASHTDVNTQVSPPTTPNSYTILSTNGSLTVGTSGATFTSITNAGGLFASLNAATITGNVSVTVITDLTAETGAVTLNTWNDGGAGDTLTISPNAATLRTISGTAVATATPMISVVIPRVVLFNGNYSGSGQYFLLRNTNSTATNAGPVIQFSGGTLAGSGVYNSIVESNATTTTTGAIVIGTGTNSATVQGCDIRSATAGTVNAYANGIYSNNASNSGIVIKNNSFYSASTGALAQTAVNLTIGGGNSITGNFIGGQAASTGVAGTPWTNSALATFTGILLNGGTTVKSEIYGNRIQNIALSGTGAAAFTGINATGLINIGYAKADTSAPGNMIGDTATTSPKTIAFTGTSSTGAINGIVASDASTGYSTIGNNAVANISTTASLSTTSSFIGISATLTGGTTDSTRIENNLIRSITLNGTGAEAFTGITIPSGSTNRIIMGDITGNTIGNPASATSIQNKGTGATIGITVTTTATGNIVTGNTVAGFTNTGVAAYTGILLSAGTTAASEITNNTLSTLTLPAGAYAFTGISATGFVNIGTKIDGLTASGNTIGSSTAGNITFGGTSASSGITLSASAINGVVVSNNVLSGITNSNATTSAVFTGINIAAAFGTTTASEIANDTIHTMSFAGTTSAGFTGITIPGGLVDVGVRKDGSTVAGNTIGDLTNSAKQITFPNASTGAIIGITVTPTTTGGSKVSNNSISNISATSASNTSAITGIAFAGAVAGTVSSNTIQNIGSSGTGAASFVGINISSTGATTVQSNVIGSTSTARSILIAGTGSAKGIVSSSSSTGTVIGGSTSGLGNTIANMTSSTSTSSQVIGIAVSAADSIKHNTISMLINSAANIGTLGSSSVIGIYQTAASGNALTLNNNITALTDSAASGAVSIIGICINGAATHTVASNGVNNFYTASATAIQQGLSIVSNAASSIVKNNMIALGYDGSGTSVSAATAISGIQKSSSTLVDFYNNSIYVGGTSVTGALNTYAFQRITNSTADIIEDNIFVNGRSNGSGTGLNYAYVLNSTTIGTSDYNIYNYPGTGGNLASVNGGTTALNMQALRSNLTNMDLHSGVGDPNFMTPAGSSSTTNLRLSNATPAEGTGILIATVTDDYDGNTRSSLTPTDIGANAGNFNSIVAATDIFSPTFTYTALGTQANCGSTITLTATVNDVGVGVPTTGSHVPRIYYRRSTGAGAPTAWASTAGAFQTGSGNSGTWLFTIDYSQLSPSTVAAGDVYQYYMVAQDTASTANIWYTKYNATSPTFTDVNTNTAQNTTNPDSYSISSVVPLSGTVYLGTGSGSPAYTSLSVSGGLFSAINTNGLSGNLTVLVQNNVSTETGAVSLGAWTEYCGSGYTLTIEPASATSYSITGTLTSGDNGLITFNGAHRVIIDGGYNSSANPPCADGTYNCGNTPPTRYLNIFNLSFTDYAPVIAFMNSSNNITVKNCHLKSTYSASTDVGAQMQSAGNQGIVWFGTSSSGSGGNSNNTIDNNLIGDNTYSSSPVSIPAPVTSDGSSGYLNQNNTISNNEIVNFDQSQNIGFVATPAMTAILIREESTIGNGGGWRINGNSFYQTNTSGGFESFSQSSNTVDVIAMLPNGSSTTTLSNNDTIYGNWIGGTAKYCGTTSSLMFNFLGGESNYAETFQGIDLACGSVYVANNTIANLDIDPCYATTFNAINFASPTTGTIANNTIGGSTSATAIYMESGLPSYAGYGYIVGIYGSTSSPLTISGNTFQNLYAYGNAAGSCVSNPPSAPTGAGYAEVCDPIYIVSGTGPYTISNNTIKNSCRSDGNGSHLSTTYAVYYANASNQSDFAAATGILFKPSGGTGHVISGNNISMPVLYTYSSGMSSVGIAVNFEVSIFSVTINNNIIRDSTGTTAAAAESEYGIFLSNDLFPNGAQSFTTYNNEISLGAINNTPTNIYGIYEAFWDGSGNVISGNHFYNSIYIGGTNANNSYALYRQTYSDYGFYGDNLTLRNNIFINNRHGYAIYNANAGSTAVNWSSNNNMLFSTGSFNYWLTGAKASLSAWTSACSCDGSSYSGTLTSGSSNYSTTTLNPSNLFNSISTPDLHVNTSDGQSFQFPYQHATPITTTAGFALNVPTDIDGDARATPNSDIGADEFPYCPAAPTGVTASASVASICAGQGSSTLSVTCGSNCTGIAYTWAPSAGLSGTTGASVTATPSVTTTYTVSGTISLGCAGTSTVTVTVNPLPTVTATAAHTTTCQGVADTLIANGANTYTWAASTGLNATSGDTVIASVSSNTTYTITGTDGNGCTNTGTVSLTTITSPSPTITPNGPINFCTGGSVILSAGSFPSYAWSDGETASAITVTSTGTYSVTVTGGNGCTGTSAPTTVTVSSGLSPVISASGPTSFCSGGSVVLSTTSSYSNYTWSTGATTSSITVTASGSYSVQVTNGSCSGNSSSTTVTVYSYPTVTASPSSSSVCPGTSATFTANCTGGDCTGITYVWSNSATASAITVSTAGTYTVTGTNSDGGCASTATVSLTVYTAPTVTAGASPTNICAGSTSNLTAGGASTYMWSTGATTSAATVTIAGTYTVTGTDSHGCTNTATVTVGTPGLSGTVHIDSVLANSTHFTSFTATSTGLFAAINANGLSGNLTVLVDSSETNETGAVALTSITNYCGSGYTISIAPNSANALTIAGSNNTYRGLLDFKGSSNVTIDGRYGGSGTYLTFNNTAYGTRATLAFENDANNITVEYCNIQGAPLDSSTQQFGAGYLGMSPAYVFIGNGVTTGNNNLVFDHNNIGSNNYIDQCFIASSTTVNNHDITITNNNIYNFMDGGYTTNDYGVYISNTGSGAGSHWNISGNSFYETGVAGGAYSQEFIYFKPGSSSISDTISGNYLGGNLPLCAAGSLPSSGYYNENGNGSTSYTSNFIDVNCGSVTISNNVIKNIRFTASTTGPATLINISGSTIASVTGNLLGDATYQVSTTGTTINDIIYAGSANGCQFTGNTMVDVKSAGGGFYYSNGIYINASGAMSSLLIQGNSIEIPRSTSSNYNSGIELNGSYNMSGSVLANRIYDNSNSTGGANYGLYLSFGSTSGTVCAITIANNMIALRNASAPFGIYDVSYNGAGSTLNYYYNSVYLAGTSTSTYNSCAYYNGSNGSGYSGPVKSMKNNIFINTRTGGTGTQTCISNRYGDPNFTSSTSDYNLLLNYTASTLGNWNGTNETFANWKTASGGDGHSVSPTYNASTSTYSSNILAPVNLFTTPTTGDLHISTSDGQSSLFVSADGTDLTSQGVTTDYDGQTRPSNPDIGADQFNFCSTPSTPVVNVSNSCGSSMLSTTASGGSLLWSPGGATASSITATNSATYSVTLTVTGGCKATGTGVSAPLQNATSTTTLTECNSFTWNGTTYTTSGAYSYDVGSTAAADGCDSTAHLNLTIKYSSSSSASHTACNSYIWNGTTYTASGTYSYDAGSNAAGCDSMANLTLTINYSSSSTTTLTECNSYSWNGTTYTASGSYSYDTGANAAGCDSTANLNLTINSCGGPTFTVKLFIQGYYLPGGTTMSPLLKLLNISSNATDVDTVTVELHGASSPYSLVDSYKGILQSNGNLVCNFANNSDAGNAYYIVIKHRNSLQTWSANTVTINNSGSYDFTTGAGQAYGSNEVNVGGVYCIYSGDVNQDGSINTSDKYSVQNAASSFILGSYNVNDVTGDGIVDEDDVRIIQNNASAGLSVQMP